jgi:hypothetical protein
LEEKMARQEGDERWLEARMGLGEGDMFNWRDMVELDISIVVLLNIVISTSIF